MTRDSHTSMKTALSALRSFYGHESFRSGQEKAVSAILKGKDILGIMPTGTGKSVCYQIPAIVSDGLTLVVSPLIALMYDQVMALKEKGVRASYLNSTLNPRQQEIVLERAAQGAYQLMYVTPERLETATFRNFAATMKIPLIAVDEAHCISRWGGDFRPAYAHISRFIQALPRRPVIAAFTATATDGVREEIVRALGMEDPVRIVSGFDRPNIRMEVAKVEEKNKARRVVSYALAHKGECGIIYCLTRRAAEELADRLSSTGLSVGCYHGGMASGKRDEAQAAFIDGRRKIMVATNAFGMGVDKPDVRYVICYSMPASIEDYYQQIGRAGRDGKPAYSLMMYSHEDVSTIRWFISHIGDENCLTPDQIKAETNRQEKDLDDILALCNSRSCLRRRILHYFGDESSGKGKCGNCSNCNTPSKQAKQARKPVSEPTSRSSSSRNKATPALKKDSTSPIEDVKRRCGSNRRSSGKTGPFLREDPRAVI